ncbi:MAG: DNA replication and repair protein RecF [Saprospiraceae bacterium]|nr:DNA replication and repair protein RecF [Saprospiraceae bacterium]
MKPLVIQEVVLTNFKNYTEARFGLGNKFNLITGLNGIGKTNLLDSIYYLCVGKSYFTPYDQRVVRQDETFFRLEADVLRDTSHHKVIIKVKPGSLKELIIDGILVNRISEHLGFIPIVFSAPRDIELVIGSSQSRRRYFDHLLCQIDPAYLRSLMAYNHLLLMRNAALKQGFPDLKRVIQTYDEQMAPHAALIYEKRKWLVDVFEPLLRQTYLTLSDNKETVDMHFQSNLHQYPYEVAVDMSWESDKNTTRSNAGIHKDDYELSIKNMSAREYGSQGQIKSLIFALHLSKYALIREQSGYKPLLMLDDIFEKLDERRLNHLMEILTDDSFGQVFISDTDHKRISKFLPGDQVHSIDM